MKEIEKAFEESQLGLNLLHYEILRLSKEPELSSVLLKKLIKAIYDHVSILMDYTKRGGTAEDLRRIKEKMKNENYGTQRLS